MWGKPPTFWEGGVVENLFFQKGVLHIRFPQRKSPVPRGRGGGWLGKLSEGVEGTSWKG